MSWSSSLLYEGYALYPYTPRATKNATPTPFGIVYPPAYAAECAGALDHARLECFAEPAPGATLSATVRYLVAEWRPPRSDRAAGRARSGRRGERATVEFEGGPLHAALGARRGLRSAPARVLVRSCVHNIAEVEAGLDRGAALAHSLISTHIVVRISAGRFVSPLETGHDSVNIWPVLATEADDAVLGAAIVLPDHPQIAPESRGNLFDNTEIEEALVLHVHALSDAERESGAEQDPAVRAMLERAMAMTPEEIIALHGGLKEVARERWLAAARRRRSCVPGRGLRQPRRGARHGRRRYVRAREPP